MQDAEGRTVPGLRSQFADDPEMAELVELFLSELPNRASAIRAAARESDAGGVRMLAHRLKGSASGYGFPTIGEAAARLENIANDPTRAISLTTEEVRDLIALCERATAKGAAGER